MTMAKPLKNNFSKNVATSLLKSKNIEVNGRNLLQLVKFAKDKNKNGYLSKEDLTVGLNKLAKQLGVDDKGSIAKPTKPIADIVASAYDKFTNYNVFLKDKSTLVFDPKVVVPRPGPLRAMAKSVVVGRTDFGGITISLANAAGKSATLDKASWVRMSFADALKGRKEDLQTLKARGYDVNAKRDLMVVMAKGDKAPTVLGVRDLAIDKEDAVRRSMSFPRPGMGGGHGDDPTRGLVSICSEVACHGFTSGGGGGGHFQIKKPVIYLYPEKRTNVSVHVAPNGSFSAQYPQTQNGTWNVVATSDGTLFDPKSEKKYSYLFWEADRYDNLSIDLQKAHLVRSEEAESFLDNACARLGLTDRERTDFVSFWIASLMKNKASVVQFLINEEVNAIATMNITPKPDAEIRMFMMFQASDTNVQCGNPTLPMLRRGKFTCVEWGGTSLDG